MDEDPFYCWMATLSKKEAKEIERGAKAVITDVVRALGGSQQTGGRLLEPATANLQFGDHEVKALRVPTGSAASRLTPSDFEQEILSAWWDCSGNPEEGARKMRVLMTPTPPSA